MFNCLTYQGFESVSWYPHNMMAPLFQHNDALVVNSKLYKLYKCLFKLSFSFHLFLITATSTKQ